MTAVALPESMPVEPAYTANPDVGLAAAGDRRAFNDVSVEFEIGVPKGMKVGVWSVNGRVSVDGATSEVRASTVNGSVDAVSSGGPVQASTVNGNVELRKR